MKIMVTGSNGFIGKNVVEYLNENYPDIGLVLPTRKNIDSMIHIPVDIIIHLAANPKVKCDMDYESLMNLHNDNIGLTHKLLAAAAKGTRFVFGSSAVVYGECQDYVDEWNYCDPGSMYAGTKLASEDLVFAYHNIGKCQGLILRYINTVGKYQTRGLVTDIIQKLQSSDPDLTVYGTWPGKVKSYMHVSDVAMATVEMALTEYDGLYNVSIEDDITIFDVVYLIQTLMQKFKTVKWLEADTWPGDIQSLKVSNKKLKKHCPMTLKYPSSFMAISKAVEELWDSSKD